MPRKPKSEKPLYKSKPPNPKGRAGSPLPAADEKSKNGAHGVTRPTDSLVSGTPMTPTHFELRDDGSVAAVCDRRQPDESERRSQSAATTSLPALTFTDPDRQLWLYQGNCLELLDAIAAKYPEGRFDAIFADPPYFLSNGGITCHAGRMVKVDKGDWDKSQGVEENHNFNREWLLRCQRVLKPNGTLWVSGTHHVIFSNRHVRDKIRQQLQVLRDRGFLTNPERGVWRLS